MSYLAEFRLVAAALRQGTPDETGAALHSQCRPDIDWGLVLRLAERHRVVPGLAAGLGRAGIVPPQPVRDALNTGLSQAALEELMLAATLKTIIADFASAGIMVGVIKGVPLSFQLHGRLGLRVSRDIDIMVSPDDVETSLALLSRCGFRPLVPLARGNLSAIIRRFKDVEVVSDNGQVVELHWRFFDNPHLMRIVSPVPYIYASFPFGLNCFTLPDRLNILYLANHGAQHAWSRLKWLADFAALLRSFGHDDVENLYASTSYADGRRCLGQALLLCADLFDQRLPPTLVRERENDWRLRWLHRIAIITLAGSADREIESFRFGSTAKNIGHYLIHGAPRYLMAEVRYDLTEGSGRKPGADRSLFGPVGRIASWLYKHGWGLR